MPQNNDALVTQLNADLVNEFGAADLANFANLLLNNHQKILGATESLWENWDDMMEVVEYIMSAIISRRAAWFSIPFRS